MKIKNKLKDEKGATAILVIFMMVLVGITIAILTKQVLSQIKTTKLTQDDIVRGYELEGAMNSTVGEFMSNINVKAVTGGVQQTEKPSYIADDAVTHRLGRYILTLVEEVGIINGTLTHADHDSSMNATVSNNNAFLLNEDLDKSIKNILGENRYNHSSHKYNINTYNAITKYLVSSSPNVGIENERELKDANLCLENVKIYLDQMDADLNSNNHNLLTESQKEHIRNNLNIANEIYNYLYYITNKYNKSDEYYNYEYFLAPNDKYASNLTQVVKDMTKGYDNNGIESKSDLETLSILLDKSEKYLNQIPELVSTIKVNNRIQSYEQTQVSEDLKKLSNNISNTKEQFVNSIKLDLENASKTSNKIERLNYIVDASIKMNKIIVMIGKVNADSILHSTISTTLTTNGQVPNWLDVTGLSNSQKFNLSESLARITVQNARRTLKATSLLCDYMEYKLSKAILNSYPDATILNNPLNALQGIKINSTQNDFGMEGVEIEQSIKEITKDIYNHRTSLYNGLKELQSTRFVNNGRFIESYDNKVKQMVNLNKYRDNSYKIPYIIVMLEEQCDKLSKLNDKHYDSENYNAERTLKSVIQYLKSVKLMLDNLVIDNTTENISFNGENTVSITFSEDMIRTLSEYNNGKSKDKVYIDLGKVKAKVILGSPDLEDSKAYEVSSSEKISLNPARSLELIVPIKVYKGNNSVTSTAYIKIYNIKILSNNGSSPKVKYDINYKINDLNID